MYSLAFTPVFFRGTERWIIVCGGIIVIYLGYKLYRFGIGEGINKVTFGSGPFKLAVSGVGPGLILITMGALILLTALFTGQGERETSVERSTTQSSPSAGSAADEDRKANSDSDFFKSGGRIPPKKPR